MRRLRCVAGSALAVAGIVAIRVGKWLITFDLHDIDDHDCAAGRCRHWESSSDGSGVVHVVPLNDGVAHTYTEDCVCGPSTQAEFRDDGSNGWIHTHHSLDGREATE